MRILHVASFTGNMGDLLSHRGLYNWLSTSIGKFQATQLEIRETYRNWDGKITWSWDKHFIHIANESDIVIIGGGNYLEPWVDESSTGTTINLDSQSLKQIKTPIFIIGVGMDFEQGVTIKSTEKLKKFLINFLSYEKNKLLLREDGSFNQLEALGLPNDIYQRIGYIPDPAFGNITKVDAKDKQNNSDIIIQLASDINHARTFEQKFRITYESFMMALMKKVYTYNGFNNLTLIPHTFDDLEMIYSLIKTSPQNIVRSNIELVGLTFKNESEKKMLEYYKKSKFAFVTRFHSVISAILMSTPFIHINTHKRIENLLKELGLSELSLRTEIIEGDKLRNLLDIGFDKNLRDRVIFIRKEQDKKGVRLIKNLFDQQ